MYKISTENIGDVKKYIWHYRKGDKESGPFTYEDIMEMVEKGEIGPNDYVLKFGNRKFIKVSEVQGLSDIIKKSEEKKEEQPQGKEEKQIATSEEQSEGKKAEKSEVRKEKVKEEYHVTFDNRASHVYRKRKSKSSGKITAIAIAGITVLCLLAWLLIRLF